MLVQYTVLDDPGLPVELGAVDAHAALSSAAWQEIQVHSIKIETLRFAYLLR